MNIAETMLKALPELNKGLDDIIFHLKPECKDEWNENYAIVQGLYYDSEGEYFDYDRFRNDYEEKVKSFFPGCNVEFYWKSQEIEVSK